MSLLSSGKKRTEGKGDLPPLEHMTISAGKQLLIHSLASKKEKKKLEKSSSGWPAPVQSYVCLHRRPKMNLKYVAGRWFRKYEIHSRMDKTTAEWPQSHASKQTSYTGLWTCVHKGVTWEVAHNDVVHSRQGKYQQCQQFYSSLHFLKKWGNCSDNYLPIRN